MDEDITETDEEEGAHNEENYLGNKQYVEGEGNEIDAEY